MSTISDCIKNWIPVRLREEKEDALCRWVWTGEQPFDHPFFDETLSALRRLPENTHTRHCESNLAILPEWANELDTVPPSAFIFHVSRCGSTLLAQYLSMNPSRIMLSEVPFLDELLRWGYRHDRTAEAGMYLKAAIRFYGYRRWAAQQELYIKTDSWHIHFHQQLRDLYPETPFILLYRRPDEIIRSQQKQRGMQSVPGLVEPGLFGFTPETLHLTDLDRHMAAVLETYYAAFSKVAISDPHTLLCNYAEGINTVFEKTLRFCNKPMNSEELKKIAARGRYHAKHPQQVFEEPPLQEILPGYLQKAMQLYEELDALRLSRN